MRTTVKTAIFIRKLTARLVQLKKLHKRDLFNFNEQEEQWRSAVLLWLKENAHKRTRELKAPRKGRRFNRVDPIRELIQGAPEPPTYPTGEAIRKVQNALRQLAMTAKPMIDVETHEIAAFFGESEDDDE